MMVEVEDPMERQGIEGAACMVYGYTTSWRGGLWKL